MVRGAWWATALLASVCAGAAGQQPAGEPSPAEVLKKSLAAYSSARSYEGTWTYTIERAGAKQSATMVIRCKGPTKLSLRLMPARTKAPESAGLDPIPEFAVVVDGTTATFENVTEKVYYSVPLPKNGAVTPVMFMPQMQTVSDVEREPDSTLDGKPVLVYRAQRSDGSESRIEIDPATYHIRRMVAEIPLGSGKIVATLAAEKETFDGPIADREFVWKAPRGAKQIPAPPGTSEMFGVPDAPTEPVKR